MTEPSSPRARRMQARILAAAEAVFLSRGYEPASMDEIAATAGVSKQTVYAHFASKEGLFSAMTTGMIGQAVAARDAAAPMPEPEGDVAGFLHSYGMAQLATPADPRLMQLRRLAIAEAERFPDLGRQVWAAGPGAAIAHLAAVFARLDARGDLFVPAPDRAARTFNWLLMGGPTSEAMLLGAPQFASAEETTAHVDEAVRVFLAAYGA